MSLELRFLPARQGDAIWIRWGESHQIMIDMGTEASGNDIRARLDLLPEDQRKFDLLVVTHVDRDHIGGVLTCLADPDVPLPGLEFKDLWFNGWDHLHGRPVPPPSTDPGLESMGPVQGERLSIWLRNQPWNEAFDRGPVVRGPIDLPVKKFPGGLQLTILGPSMTRLESFQDTWKEDVEEALAKGTSDEVSPGLGHLNGGLERFGPSTPPKLDDHQSLDELADSSSSQDPSIANSCSISFLLEWEGRKILFTGDAFAEDIVDALSLLNQGEPVTLDLFKLPHHGSKNNISDDLVKAVRCRYWLFSSDGTQFRHPDAIAIARILRSADPHNPTLGFNVPSKFNGWWDNQEWRDRFGYLVEYGDPNEGLTVRYESV